ncbi:hypothetical protein M9H77_05500 [Catharanthus roseus]|uniref:Uncharacterized protein n=1 Tax=Catharanthus roseus TaxID=4058 RepID=A0ACC0CHF2_CATRO|nr:hypothetical protein M9H77_05500 [Catharanthus roseus]
MLPATVGFNVSSSSFILNASSSSSSFNHAFPNRNCMSIKNPITKSLNCSSFQPFQLKFRRNLGISASSSAVSEFTSTDDSILSTPPQKQKLGVVVKPMEKPRLVLKFLWMEKNIGLAIDQVIPGHGTIPLSPYYFWPRKDAWEELKVMLEKKPWISQKQMVILLNQATDIINLWQQSGGDLT